MASSGKRKPAEKPSRAPRRGLANLVAANLKDAVKPGERLVIALSGGVDSMVLLDVLAALAPRMGFRLDALHVNHQLSPNAAAWARFCRAECGSRGLRLRVVKVDVQRGNSIERAAREARYAALLDSDAAHVVLAHNQDDQAETVLMNLLRGSGVKGLAAMRAVRRPHPFSSSAPPSILRPFLDVSRSEIERYAKRRRLRWIEDESNEDTRFTRNWLRREVLPRLATRVPGYRDALARAAGHLGEAAALLDELARIDLKASAIGSGLSVEALRALGLARAKNVLRFAIEARGWQMPDAVRLSEALRQALTARAGARVAVDLGSCELRRHGGATHLVESQAGPADDAILTWRGEDEIELPGSSGVLTMAARVGAGMSVLRLGKEPVTIRRRRGGERLQPDAKRPRRTVKNLLQEAGIPAWQRERLPFIYCGDDLVCVPGVGVDCRFSAKRGEPSILPSWREASPVGARTQRRGGRRPG